MASRDRGNNPLEGEILSAVQRRGFSQTNPAQVATNSAECGTRECARAIVVSIQSGRLFPRERLKGGFHYYLQVLQRGESTRGTECKYGGTRTDLNVTPGRR